MALVGFYVAVVTADQVSFRNGELSDYRNAVILPIGTWSVIILSGALVPNERRLSVGIASERSMKTCISFGDSSSSAKRTFPPIQLSLFGSISLDVVVLESGFGDRKSGVLLQRRIVSAFGVNLISLMIERAAKVVNDVSCG
jgi:hypothetical protein